MQKIWPVGGSITLWLFGRNVFKYKPIERILFTDYKKGKKKSIGFMCTFYFHATFVNLYIIFRYSFCEDYQSAPPFKMDSVTSVLYLQYHFQP
jgi:hypothetical protein